VKDKIGIGLEILVRMLAISKRFEKRYAVYFYFHIILSFFCGMGSWDRIWASFGKTRNT